MTNKSNPPAWRRPWFGFVLGGLDRLSSAGGKALLDSQLLRPNGPLQIQHATSLEATFGGLFLLLRVHLSRIPSRRKKGGAVAPGGVAERPAKFRRLALLVQHGGSAQGGSFLPGVACAVGAGFARTSFLPVTDRLIQGAGRPRTERVIAWSTLAVGLLAGGVVAVTGGFARLMSWPVIGCALLVGLLNNTLPRIIQMPARELAGDAVYAVFLVASPAIATLVGVAFLGDRLGGPQWAGLVIMVLAGTAVAYMSFDEGGHHAPLGELSGATVEEILAALEKTLSERVHERDLLTREIGDLKVEVAEARFRVAEEEHAETRAVAEAAAARLAEAETWVQAARDQAHAARDRVRGAEWKLVAAQRALDAARVETPS